MSAYDLRSHSGNAPTTTLAGNINASDLSFSVANGSGYPDGSAGPFVTTLDEQTSTEEKLLCTSRSGNVFTVDALGRGYDGTTPASHASGTGTVNHTWSATEADEASQVAHQVLGQITSKGDLLSGTNLNQLARTAVGADGLALVADGTQPGGLSWEQPVPAAHDHSGVTQGGVLPESSVQQLLADLTARLQLAGGTMTGALLLAADPVLLLGAATKQYVDAETARALGAESTEAAARTAADLLLLALAGGTMTGLLLLSGDPVAALGAATKQYVDGLQLPGTWTTFTPTLHGSTGGGSIGNAVDHGSMYRLEANTAGKVLDVFIDFTTGTTTSFGTGTLLIDLPAGLAAPAANPAHVGDGLLLQAAGLRKGVVVEMNSTTQFLMANADDGATVSGSTPSPFSFGIGSTIRARLRLRVA